LLLSRQQSHFLHVCVLLDKSCFANVCNVLHFDPKEYFAWKMFCIFIQPNIVCHGRYQYVSTDLMPAP